jgi:hypothetical protein
VRSIRIEVVWIGVTVNILWSGGDVRTVTILALVVGNTRLGLTVSVL